MVWPFTDKKSEKTESSDGAESADKPAWVEVTPGDHGTPLDEFLGFTYWVPSDALRESFLRDARESGAKLIPDVTAPKPLDEPDGLTRLRGVVTNAVYGRAAAATELFQPTKEQIADVTTRILQGFREANNEPNSKRNWDSFIALYPELAELEAEMKRLERALLLRTQALLSHFDAICGEFVHELKDAHEFGHILATRWDPERLPLTDDMLDFGQHTAREQIERALNFAQEGGPQT
ncbi:MAG: hypothetical protein QM621_04305 [Aeromicrobium sp.]|uniref:hypothetical protein n=1 Tax=Aeromicrobium sp. TaxID=1871063 RepID=UPI0039E27485